MNAVASTMILLLAACGGSDGEARDAAPDVDNGMCGTAMRFTGEYIDWNSGASFCGINGAKLTPPGGGAVDTTPPNGRVDLCVPSEAQAIVEITPSTVASQCTTTRGMYSLPAIAVANKAVIAAGGMWRGRAFETGTVTVDPSKAQLFVHIIGTPTKATINATHGPTQARNSDAWTVGETGEDLFFPDVDPTTGSTTLSAGTALGTGMVPLVAGKLTNVTIIVR